MEHALNASGQPIGTTLDGWPPPSPPKREPMHGRFCILEPLVPQRHGQDLYEAYAQDLQGLGWTYLPYGPFQNFEAFNAWLTASTTKDPLFFAIVDRTTRKATGLASYLRIDPPNGCIEVGHLHFATVLQSTPAATEAMFLMMQQAFESGYRRYEWKCNALNASSRRAAQRLGFSFEGVFRQAAVVKGANRDTAWYSIIDKEWPVLRAAFEQWLAPTNFDEDGHQRMPLSTLTAALLHQQG